MVLQGARGYAAENQYKTHDCPHHLVGLRAVVCTWKKTCALGRKNIVARDPACRASVCPGVGAVSLQVFHSDGSPAVTGTGQDTWEAREDALDKTGDDVEVQNYIMARICFPTKDNLRVAPTPSVHLLSAVWLR